MIEIYFETYGCTTNYNSTEIIKGILRQAGLNITSNLELADFVVINSCIVKQPTEEKIKRRISDILKKNKKIILTGCMPFLRHKNLEHYDNLYFLDNSQIKNIKNIILDITENNYDSDKYLKKRKEIKLNLPKIPKEKTIGITQISEGCLGNCNYCITRFAKGTLFSYPLEDILKSIESDIQAGCKEIWITSQDCASYGLDNGNYSLPELLKKIIEIKGKFFLRIGMMNPDNVLKILPELIEIYKHEKVFKFLHIPVQSGSDNILKKMNRKYTKKDFIFIIDEFKKNFPDIHISTDVILGYDNETEDDFRETYNLIDYLKPETININRFWPRPGTPAENIKPVSKEIMKKRAISLAQLHKKICINNQEKFIGKTSNVLVDQKGFENTYLARDKNYKLYAVLSKEKILGKLINIKVKKTTPHYLIAEKLK